MNKELLTELFATDEDLLQKYHILAPNSAEVCAERTMKDLEDSKVQVHLIEQNGEVIGYYGIEGKVFLTGFFLKPKNRDVATIELFWSRVNKHFRKDFMVCLYTKNTRAISFMNKKTNQKTTVGDDVVVFTVRR